MKNQFYLPLLVLMMLTSCASYKYVKYEKKSQGLDEKLPKLTLEIDTSSVLATFNQLPYTLTEYYGKSLVSVGEIKDLCKEKGKYNILSDYEVNELLKSQSLFVIKNTEYSMPDIYKNGTFNWSYKALCTDCSLYRNDSSFFLSYPNILTNKVVIWTKKEVNSSISLNSQGLITTQSHKPYGTTQMALGSDIFSSGLILDNNTIIVDYRLEGKYDLRAGDQFTYYKYTVDNNICNQDSMVSGKIKFEIVDSKLINGWGWLIPSTLTLFTINFLGFPIAGQGVKLSLKCTITNMNNSEIYSKIVSTKGKAYSAMYWGVGFFGSANRTAQGGTHRAANMRALSKAINLIIEDIERNKTEILTGLK